ncbi:hypothetical protein AVEN_216064-1 [Araneus ventricosus]|uniref:Uncharacterized protein n=1 Tax=Araneus ventricosus TaxID=182803 RepID=A0A4Y2T4W6_ARAVE|nr:hypothetical protein AVEN_216064-1 [Araneus ventricosus]
MDNHLYLSTVHYLYYNSDYDKCLEYIITVLREGIVPSAEPPIKLEWTPPPHSSPPSGDSTVRAAAERQATPASADSASMNSKREVGPRARSGSQEHHRASRTMSKYSRRLESSGGLHPEEGVMIGEDLQKFSGSRVMRTTSIGRFPTMNLPKSVIKAHLDR